MKGAYFLVSVSTRRNLELCKRYGLAGFTNSINGLWAFWDIDEGDYISFLYGAKVHNLYRVEKKVAYRNATFLPPWPPVTFSESKRTYSFPFRLHLSPVRELEEPMVRLEFSYVAENLLLRGGYRKSHFQADTPTFYNVSEMGGRAEHIPEFLEVDGEPFEPRVVFRKESVGEGRFLFREQILQLFVRKKLSTIFDHVLELAEVDGEPEDFEFLGEKALSEGFVDIFVKPKHPSGTNHYFLIEVKRGKAYEKEGRQLLKYVRELREEYVIPLMVAKDFGRRFISNFPSIVPITYSFSGLDESSSEGYTYSDLLRALELEILG